MTYLKNEFFSAASSYSILHLGHWIYTRVRRFLHWILGRNAEYFGLKEAWEAQHKSPDHTWSWLSLFISGTLFIWVVNYLWRKMNEGSEEQLELEQAWSPEESSRQNPNSATFNQIPPYGSVPYGTGLSRPFSAYGGGYGNGYGGYGSGSMYSGGYGSGYGSGSMYGNGYA